MRDPDRIVTVMAALLVAWQDVPDMRLGQLLVNITGKDDLFYVEDDVLLDEIQEWVETSRTWKAR